MCQYFPDISQGLNLSLCVIQMQSTDCNIRLQSDCGDCSLIVEIAVRLLRLQKFRNLHMVPQPSTRTQACWEVFFSDCWDCSLIAEIAVWLLRLQSDCWDCKSSTTYIWCPNPAQGVRHVARCFTLIAEIAVWLLRFQKFGNLLIHVPALNKDSGMLRGVLFWLQRLHSDCCDCSQIVEIAH